MTLLALLISFVLTAIALLHAAWAVGIVWPGKDAESCARTVVGARGITTMPSPLACWIVAATLLAVAALPLILIGRVGTALPDWLSGIGGPIVACVFLTRGILGYLPVWRRKCPEQPFATLDRRFYSPICLALGAGIVLTIGGLAR